MAPNRHGRVDLQTLGLIAAVLTAVLSGGFVVWLMVSGPGGNPPAPESDRADPLPPDINDVARGERTIRGRDLTLEFTDEDDPQKVIGTLIAGSLDPLPGRHYDATRVNAWVYLEDGRSLRIAAPSGKLYMPSDNRLESGTLGGGVVIELHAEVDGARRPASPDDAEPLVTATTPELRFDLGLSEVATERELSVRSERMDFDGVGVRVLFNKPQQRLEFLEVRRGGSITIRPASEDARDPSPALASADPDDRAPGGDSTGSGAGDRSTPQSPSPPPGDADRAPTDDYYRAVFSTRVVATTGSRRLTGDELQIWVHTVGNKLPPGALGEASARGHPGSRVQLAMRGPGLGAAPATIGLARLVQPDDPGPGSRSQASNDPSPQPDPDGSDQEADDGVPTSLDDPLVVTWEETLTARWLESRPDQLEDQHVAGVITAAQTGVVVFEDPDAGVTGRCATAEYRATSRDLWLSGPGTRAVVLDMPGTGTLETGRVEVSLDTGVVGAPGPGRLGATGDEGSVDDPIELEELTWTERADFEFELREGRMTETLRRAWFEGAVQARKGASSIRGDRLDAVFRPREDRSGSDLERADVTGRAIARDGSARQLAGDRLIALFEPESEHPGDPRVIMAEGGAVGTLEDASLRGDRLELLLSREPLGANGEQAEQDQPADERGAALEVRLVRAEGSVELDRPSDRLEVRSETLVADAELDQAQLEGSPARVAMGRSVLTGDQVVLGGGTTGANPAQREAARRVEVFGAGTFEMEGEGGSRALAATWTTQMFLDDDAGTLDCYGDVLATWHPDPLTTDTVRGEHLHVDYEPDDDPLPGAGLAFERSDQRRQILGVRVVGGLMLDPESGAPAVVQTLTERGTPSGPPSSGDASGVGQDEPDPIERLLRLEGPEIVADNRAGTIRVDHPGRLVVADHRGDDAEQAEQGTSDSQAPDTAASTDASPSPSDGQGSATPLSGDGVRGSALFTWRGSMLAERESGRIVLDRGVRMDHVRLGDRLRTELDCERLTAHVRIPDQPEPTDAQGAEPIARSSLDRVQAQGAVLLRSGEAELLADELDYDASSGIAIATASPDNTVTYFDPQAGAPVTAKRLRWDLISGRIEVDRPGGASAPR